MGIRNDTVTVKGELFLKPLGDREGKVALNQVRRTALLRDPRFAVYESVFSITIQNFFLCIAKRILYVRQAAAESSRFFVCIADLENT